MTTTRAWSLFGRDSERDRVHALLGEGEALITIVGPPGVGKTAFARAISRSLPFAVFVDEGSLADAVASKPAVLVVDGASAEAVAAAAESAPEAQIIVASRERLQLPLENVLELSPLGLEAATQLFVAHARKLGRDVGPSEMPFVLEIVRKLDQIPLAIELAASRLRVMAPRALLHRLESSLEVLAKGDGATRGLDVALKGVFDGLLPHEREALGQLTVFQGGFRLDSAESVVLPPATSVPVIDIVASLRDKSLLIERSPGRLDMLSVVRDRARANLDATALTLAEQRHSSYFGALAQKLTQGDRAMLVAERGNILAVAQRLLAKRPVTAASAEPALQAMAALGQALLDAGPLESFEAALEPTLVATQGSGARPALEAAAVLTRGSLRLRRGDLAAASRDLVQALGVAKATRDAALEARATLELGRALELRGDDANALEHYDRAATLFDAIGSPVDHGRALEAEGLLLAAMGRSTEALALLHRAVSSSEASPFDAASAKLARAAALLDAGDTEAAAADIDEAAADDAWRSHAARAMALRGLARHDRGDAEGATELYARALAEMRSLGAFRQAARVEILYALARRELGHSGDAYVLLKSALATLRDTGEAAACGAHLAMLELEAARPDQARALLGAFQGASGVVSDVVAVAHARLDPSLPMSTARTAHGRIARRVWQAPPSSNASPPPDDALLVGPLGAWFRMPGAQRQSLERRRNLALILAVLTTERVAHPGAPVLPAALLVAGWPGEKVIATAGAHRVRVAVATLRKLGLKDAIVTAPEGYLLATALRVVCVD